MNHAARTRAATCVALFLLLAAGVSAQLPNSTAYVVADRKAAALAAMDAGGKLTSLVPLAGAVAPAAIAMSAGNHELVVWDRGQIHHYDILSGVCTRTTITAMVAALSTAEPAAVTVAFAHFFFNVAGALIIYVPKPMRAIPLAMARAIGRLGANNRPIAVVYIVIGFFGIPLLLLLISGVF